jgi:hypothetical protein
MKNKYSLDERSDHHGRIVDKWVNRKDKTKKRTPKVNRSFGWLQAVERGRPMDFEQRPPAYRKGVIAGEKAKARVSKVKF